MALVTAAVVRLVGSLGHRILWRSRFGIDTAVAGRAKYIEGVGGPILPVTGPAVAREALTREKV